MLSSVVEAATAAAALESFFFFHIVFSSPAVTMWLLRRYLPYVRSMMHVAFEVVRVIMDDNMLYASADFFDKKFPVLRSLVPSSQSSSFLPSFLPSFLCYREDKKNLQQTRKFITSVLMVIHNYIRTKLTCSLVWHSDVVVVLFVVDVIMNENENIVYMMNLRAAWCGLIDSMWQLDER